MAEKQIVPAILVKSKKELAKKIKQVEKYVQRVQIDVVDGKFSNNKTIGPAGLKGMRTKAKIEAHLMVKDIGSQLDKFIKLKPWMITFHIESCKSTKHAQELADRIKKAKIKAGISIKPETPASRIKPLLKNIDLVLVMTVHPGFYGGKFLPKMLLKIRQIRKWGRKTDIEVDGGIKPGTARQCAKAGANIFVSGSFIYKAKDIKKAIQQLRRDVTCMK